MWSNFHMHSKYCDGKGELMDYVQQAKSLQMISLGFSSHAPVPFDSKWCMKKEDLPEYLHTIDALKKTVTGIELYKGLEIDFIPDVISVAQFEDRLDYTVGSVHFVDATPAGDPWEIDGLHTVFLDGLDRIFNNDSRAAFSRYFELTREMVQTAPPSIIGHLDKIKIQNPDEKFFRESDTWYQDEIQKTLDVIAGTSCIVEVNTRGIYQKKSKTTYPSPWVLERIHKKKIPVTISSDAHHPSDIINHFSETAALLQDIGFTSMSVLHEGNWQPFSFNTHGIIR